MTAHTPVYAQDIARHLPEGLISNAIKVTNVDNDVAGMTVNIPGEGYEILEGQTYPLTLKLNTKPKKPVTVALSTDDDTEAKFEQAKVELNDENWKSGVPVILNAVADHFIDGDQPVKLTFTATSEDEDYNLTPLVFDATVKDTDVADIYVNMGDSPIVKEGSDDLITMSVSLTSMPKEKVTIDIAVSDETELKANKNSIEIAPNHWDIALDILINSVDDDIVDGNVKSKVTLKMTSADANFNNVTKEIEFTTVDDDVAGFVISSNAASFPESSGATTSMSVALQSQPTANVTVTVASTDASELSVTSATTLTFTPSNWKTPQNVTAKVVDDSIADGTQTAAIKFTAASTDTNFNGITGQSALYTIIDDDAPSLSLAADPTTISQGSPTSTASIALGVEPTSDVTITLTSDLKAVTFNPATLTFTSKNYNTPQKATINVDFDAIATASAVSSIKATATANNSYNGKASNTVDLNLVKIAQVQNFAYTGGVQTVNLPKGKYKLEVWGAQGANVSYKGGYGGYSAGTFTLNTLTPIYIVVGGQGTTVQASNSYGGAGYNGGGDGSTWNSGNNYGGGGATHIATANGVLSSLSNNKSSVVIVAGGGGGATNNGSCTGGYGGGTTGGLPGGNYPGSTPGTQTEGGSGVVAGSFGQGGSCHDTVNVGWVGGGGGGYYGGGSGMAHGGGSGGSGYLKPELTSSQTIPGNASMPAPAGGTETGHMGNGYARITLVQ